MNKMMPVLEIILAGQLADPDSHWGLGSFGAIAEFTRDHDEAVTLNLATLTAVTPRGGIHIVPRADWRPFAYETAAGTSWSQNVALCLPADAAAMHKRAVLTEIGPDDGALRDEDKTSMLFDLGLGIAHVDACIRLRDAAAIDRLRGEAGKNVFAPDSSAMRIVLAAQPHRVFMSRCGRIEVYQPIPPPDGRSPLGPHTHVLPKLLGAGRTHAATDPIPPGLAPCLSLYPAHPAKDALGRARAFQATRHDAFQALLRCYGDPETVRLKTQIIAALAGGMPPPSIENGDRFARACIRVALRQMQAAGWQSPALAPWLAQYERPGPQDHTDISGCH